MATPGIYEEGKGVVVRFVAPMTIKSNQPVFSMDTLSLKRQTTSQKAQRWEITTNLEPSNTSIDYFMSSVLNGFDHTITIQMPQLLQTKARTSTIRGDLIITANAVKGQTTVQAGNGVATGNIYRGEFIKFGNDDKVYLVKQDFIGGVGNLEIYPPLRKNTPNGTSVLYRDNVLMHCLYDTTTVLGITYKDGILSDPGSITLIEDL
jgi:alpha-amylase/alpha-mannosidase (GH57 family)